MALTDLSLSLDGAFVKEIAQLGAYREQVEQCFRLFATEADERILLKRLWHVVKTTSYLPGEPIRPCDLILRWINDAS